MWFPIVVVFSLLSFVSGASYVDTFASTYKIAEQACNQLASGSSVRSFDISEATCENGVHILEFRKKVTNEH